MRKPAAFALTLLALFDSLYLWWVYASPSHPMVCLGDGCDVVRASRYAHFLGYPTPAYGVLLYAALALLIFAEPLASPPLAVWLRRLTALLAGAGFAVALWLTGIEAFVLHAWCTWCTLQWMAVTLTFLLSLSLLRGASYADCAGALAMVRRQSVVLLVAIVVGVPAFTHLMRVTELLPPAAALPSAADLAERLIRPDSHVTGNPQAAASLVEFGDLQCPSCAVSEQTVRELRQRYGDRVRFVFRQFPLERIHQYALHAAEATECAADQGKFWESLDRLYGANPELSDDSLKRYAAELGLELGKFNACMSSGATLARIRRDADDGHALGVRATPTFFIGRQRVEGALDMARFEQLLGQELASAGPAPAPVGQEKKRTMPAAKAASAAGPSPAGGGFGGNTNPFLNLQGASTDCSENAAAGPQPVMIRTPKAEELYRAKSLFVDVRSPEAFQKERIAGAINIPMNEAGIRADKLPRDRAIVLYEGSSGASGDVCAASRAVGRLLLSHGYRQVLVYQDGLQGWRRESLPVER